MRRSPSFVASLAVVPVLSSASLLLAPLQPARAFSLINGGFEQPVGVNSATVTNCPTCYIPQDEVPGWDTSDSTGKIEIWVGGSTLPLAYQGNQYAELNSFSAATLFQDVAPIAVGNLVGYELAHRGRDGLDTMRLDIIDLGTDNTPGGVGPAADTTLFSRQFTTGNTAWGFYSQANVATTLGNTIRFSYTAISSAGGITTGNFLDATAFGVGVPSSGVPAPMPLLGAGAAFGFSRRLRRRIRAGA